MKDFFLAIQRLLLGLFVLGVSLAASTAIAEACEPIVSVPVTITAPGTYCLTGDLNYSDFYVAIDIQTDDVTLDFKGYELKGSLVHKMKGVLVTGNDTKNVVVRNGKITNADYAIRIGTSSVVENMVIHDVRMGIIVGGENSVVRNNTVTNVYTPFEGTASGIYILGCNNNARGTRVVNNTILDFRRLGGNYPGSAGYGIQASGCQSIISGNNLHGVFANGTARQVGIYIPNNADSNLVIGNRFSGSMDKELSCAVSDSTRYKDNISTSMYSSSGEYDCHSSGDLGGNL